MHGYRIAFAYAEPALSFRYALVITSNNFSFSRDFSHFRWHMGAQNQGNCIKINVMCSTSGRKWPNNK